METPQEYHYTYYSYEEWGRGYFGSRTCKCLPEEDIRYFGSFRDKTFKPTQKIILKSDYTTRAEADADEVLLHDYFEVDINPHFANRARQTSTKFRCPDEVFRTKEFREKASSRTKGEKNPMYGRKRPDLVEIMKNVPKEVRINAGKKGGAISGKINGPKTYELGIGVHGLTPEQRTENGKKGGNKTKNLGVGIFGLTPEEKSKNSKKAGSIGGRRNVELGTGLFSMTDEEKRNAASKGGKAGGKKGGNRTKELGVGFFAMSEEEKYQARSKGGKTGIGGRKAKELGVGIFALSKEQRSENAKITNSQKWMCLETGFITHPGTLTGYQRARGIDTSQRVRVS
jgi:hypothetical protein